MFDFGFWELVLIALIALVVLGPERLPVVARTAGRWVRQAREYMNALTSELEREVASEDIRRDVRETREHIESEIRSGREESKESVDSVMRPLADDLREVTGKKGDPSKAADAAKAADGTAGQSESAVAASDKRDENSVAAATSRQSDDT